MTAIYLIGLREGLEATLVVSILVAFLVKSDRSDRLPLVWAGVAAAVALSVGFGALLHLHRGDLDASSSRSCSRRSPPSLAVVFVTWMIFWMRRVARRMRRRAARQARRRARRSAPLAVAVMAFLAVAREGLETSLLFFAAAQGATDDRRPADRHHLGLLTAVVLGWLLYRSAVRINLDHVLHLDRRAAGPGRRRHLQVRRARPAGGRRPAGPEHPTRSTSPAAAARPLVRRAARAACSTSRRSRACWRRSPGSSTSSRSLVLFLLPAAQAPRAAPAPASRRRRPAALTAS